jgi:hypothetical protein
VPEPLAAVPAEDAAAVPVSEAYSAEPLRRRPPIDLEPHRGTLILVLGILSLVACGFFGPVAWIMGSNDLREIEAGRMDPAGEGQTRAGRVCGIIGTILLVLSVPLCCVGGLVWSLANGALDF